MPPKSSFREVQRFRQWWLWTLLLGAIVPVFILLGGHGWAYNVSGNKGVQLEIEGGECLLMSSQRAEEIEATIRRRLPADDGSQAPDGG